MSDGTDRPTPVPDDAEGTPPEDTDAALPLAGAALVDEETPEEPLDPTGAVLPAIRLEGTQPGGMPPVKST